MIEDLPLHHQQTLQRIQNEEQYIVVACPEEHEAGDVFKIMLQDEAGRIFQTPEVTVIGSATFEDWMQQAAKYGTADTQFEAYFKQHCRFYYRCKAE